MQIIHWLPNIASESPKVPTFSPFVKKKGLQDRKIGSIVLRSECELKRRQLKRVEQIKLCCKSFNIFYVFQEKDVPKTWSYHTFHLKGLVRFRRRQNSVNSMKMKSEEIIRGLTVAHIADSSTTYIGSKISPLTDITQSYAANCNDQCNDGCTEEKVNGRKTKAISRMKKELLKWVASAPKAEKGGKCIGREVMHLRNKSALKTVPDYDQLSKMSSRWDMESCSTAASSEYSAISDAILMTYSMRINDQAFASAAASVSSTPSHAGRGNWITTDSEFVVLEL